MIGSALQMESEYDSQATFIREVEPAANKRAHAVERTLRKAFARFLQQREVDIVLFRSMSAKQLAAVLCRYPMLLKPLLSICNLGARAVERDLGLRGVNTYEPRLTEQSAFVLAGYIMPFLPQEIELSSLVHLDRVEFIDKEVRTYKGNWEKRVRDRLNSVHPGFKKRSFVVDGERFEIDAAWPDTGDIRIAVDVKRIEAPRDIHKRCDEIVNKAAKYNSAFPRGKFAAVVYYPFVSQHENVASRLRSDNIDAAYFAGATDMSIETATTLLLAELWEKDK